MCRQNLSTIATVLEEEYLSRKWSLRLSLQLAIQQLSHSIYLSRTASDYVQQLVLLLVSLDHIIYH